MHYYLEIKRFFPLCGLIHNHPSGDPTPSAADIDMTQRIAATARPLGIELHDHLIIGKGRHASFRALKLL